MNIRVGDKVQWGSDMMWGTVTKVNGRTFDVLWSGNAKIEPWTIKGYTWDSAGFSRHVPCKPTIILS